MNLIRVLTGWALLTLAGCATVSTVPPAVVDAQDSPAALQAWSLEGRIGAQSGSGAWQANLFWEHAPTQDRLRISGPLNQGVVSIVVQKDLIFINEGNGVETLSRDPDDLLRRKLGFVVPLSSLRYWIMGIPDPDAPHRRDEGGGIGAVAGFRQAGWRILPERMANVEGWMLPQRVSVQGPGVRLRILADDWSLRD